MQVEHYIKKECNAQEIPEEQVDHKFISGFEYYLNTERNGHNSAIKSITSLKKIIKIAFTQEIQKTLEKEI